VRNEEEGHHGRGDDPGGEALDDPVDLPGPALDLAEWDEVGGGGEAPDQVVDDAEKEIGSHVASLLRKINLEIDAN
jgi:hypothetical protein